MVSIITVNFNQTELTCALLDSIRKQDYRNVEILVVDNASRENPAAIFQSGYPEVKFIRSEKNLGFAGGNNLALPHAKGDFLFFVNNDAEIKEGCIAGLLDFLEKTPGSGIVSPLICYGPREDAGSAPLRIQYAGMPPVSRFTARSNMDGNGAENRGQYASPFRTGYAHGAAMMISRRVLDEVGPMLEDYFLYYEEIDWCERLRKAGYSIWVEPRAVLWHKESMTMKSLGSSKTYYLSRNRILFMRRHYAGWNFPVFMAFMLCITVPRHVFGYVLRGEWRPLQAFLNGVMAGFFKRDHIPVAVDQLSLAVAK